MSDLVSITARLNAATPGPWAIWRDLDHQGFKTVGDADSYAEIVKDGFTEEANPTAHVYTNDDAEFIAHAPSDIGYLLTEEQRWREAAWMYAADVSKLEAQRDAVLALHTVEKRWQSNRDEERSFDTAEEAAEYHDMAVEEMTFFEVCYECGRIEMSQSDECDYLDALWPCATVAALGGTTE